MGFYEGRGFEFLVERGLKLKREAKEPLNKH